MIDLLITDRKVSILHTEQIVSGNRNTYTVRYHFDQNSHVDWKRCMKVAVFASVSPIGAKKVRIAKLDAEDRCLIPQSILMHDAATVFAGVSGVYPNEDVVASQMCRIGAVDPGANGETFPMDEVPQSVMDSFLADVAELLAETSEKSHVHTNMDTLDRIGADGDKLTFDGVSVGGNDSRVDDLIYDVSSLQKTAHTHANMDALERIGQDTDDVVLMPMGEPLHLIARADFGSAPMYAMESFIRQNDPKLDFYVDGADGTRIRIACNGFDVCMVEVNGTGYEFGAVELPETFTVTSVNGYASLEGMPSDMLEAYRTFCSFVNTSAEAMGSGTPIAGKAEIPTVGLLWNRTYAMRLDYADNDSIDIFFAENADEGMISQEAYTTVYVYFPKDVDVAISGVDYFVGGVPQTTQGWHKWIFNRLPDGKVSLGALDMEAIT